MDTWETAIPIWLLELRAANTSEGTIELRKTHLRWWARVCPHPWSASYSALIAFMACERWAPETRRSVRSTLRGFYGWAYREGHMDQDPACRLPKVRIPISEPRPADDQIIRDVLHRADRRERILLYLMAEGALRRAEAARVHTRDLEAGDMLRVYGKGGRQRLVPLTGQLYRALRDRPDGWVFPNGHGGHLTSAHVGVLLRRILPKDTTPHMLRHAAASALAEDPSVNMFDVRDFLGHASVATTQRYVRVKNARIAVAARSAARRFDVA
jgi:integrase